MEISIGIKKVFYIGKEKSLLLNILMEVKKWYKKGSLYREGDLPAIKSGNGSKYWYKEGKLHR